MGLIGSRRFVALLAVAVVAKSLLIAGLVASPVGPAPTLASGTGDEVDQPRVEGNGTSDPDGVTEDPGPEGSEDADAASPDRCDTVCDPLRA